MIQNLSMLYSPSFIWSVCSVHADSFVINTDVLRSFLDPLCQKWQLCIFTLTSGTCLYGHSEPNHSDFLTNCSDCNAMNAREKLMFLQVSKWEWKDNIRDWSWEHLPYFVTWWQNKTNYSSYHLPFLLQIKWNHETEVYWQKYIQMFTKYIFLETISYKYHHVQHII